MVRTALAALLLSTVVSTPVLAQARPVTDAAMTSVSMALAQAPGPVPSPYFRAPGPRSGALTSLYVSLSALQAYDVYSTLTAMQHGAVEANPMMRGVVGHPMAFVAVKAGVTGASIYAAEKLWKQNKRTKAILLMVASNGLMAYVAANNAAVLRSIR